MNPQITRLLERASPTADGCLVLPGSPYRKVTIDGRPIGAHVAVYVAHKGPIPPGKLVRHRCHDGRCVAPEHLRSGTPADNSRDMAVSGRAARGRRNARSRLSPGRVLMVRLMIRGGATHASIARQLGVTRQAIGYVASGAVWGWYR